MAGLEGLASLIYHEKQQEGSMLCGQHALNSLLQGNYFTAPDLSAIASSLDVLEQNVDAANLGSTSTNMDNTGFFSVQVLEKALSVWGLTLVRWRSEELRPHQDRPHTQLAFILNYQMHWYTLRRFGPAVPNFLDDPGHGHWFNLNSFLNSPEWVGKLYLGMVLQQAEADGYSVFAVIQANPSAPLALPHTEADEVASTLPEPSQPRSESHNSASFDDEDFELQAALQASITGTASYVPASGSIPELESSSAQDTVSGAATPTAGATSNPDPAASGTGVDPVAASMTRNRIVMERMRREQELAQRDLYEAESNRIGRRRNARQEEEEELLQRAIAESKAEAQREGRALEDDEDEMEPDVLPPVGNLYPNDRVYDDEDEELQMALQESLEAVPEGFPSDIPPPLDKGIETSSEVEVNDTSVPSSHQQEVPQEAQAVNIDELRKKRLARFGG